MKKTFLYFSFIFISLTLGSVKLVAQTVPVGMPVLEDSYRRAQLLGELDSSISFTIRPLFPTKWKCQKFNPDSTVDRWKGSKIKDTYYVNGKRGLFKILPITWIQQVNSDHPDGINDGAMIPARGYQTLFSAGIFAQYGPLTIQLKPEMVYATNIGFNSFPTGIKEKSYPVYLSNLIDLPERFGENPYKKIFWGQSNIRLTIGATSIGLSNENLWWGPGLRNSLMMTNNAPGFEHFTINTVRPVHTPIGSFEGQMVCGKLVASGMTPSSTSDWRYLNGLIVSYQPKWVPGLFLGAIRSFINYNTNVKSFKDYFPIIIPITKKGDGQISGAGDAQDQLASIFARWLWQEEHGEIYFEYGREDHNWDTRDLLQEASHSSAYILGIRKLIPLNTHSNEYLQINMELTQLESNTATINRGWTIGWYTHSDITEGYTNLGQVLGAGIGPGSNLQTINVGWVKGLKTITLQFERFVHDNNYHYDVVQDIRRNWVDLSGAVIATWDYKNLLLNITTQFIRSINYEWQYAPKLTNPQQYWNQSKDLFNFHGQLGITYRF
jgi:hypothetical protein